MASANHYDVITIGSGAGGRTLAYHLAPSGKPLHSLRHLRRPSVSGLCEVRRAGGLR
jgi:pyruvate/2-oxoglutarate dehydrogenase complex dihydrolipoamide dehydrogenase (E3) component